MARVCCTHPAPMLSYHVPVGKLQVKPSGLTDLAGRCQTIARELAEVAAPTSTGPTGLASTAAVRLSHQRVAGVVAASTGRMQSTALRLASAAAEFENQQARSAAGFAVLERAIR